MADLSITVAQLLYVSGNKNWGTAGEAITEGMPVYLKSSDGLIYKSGCASTAAIAACIGIALTSSATSQPVCYQTSGTITLGAGAAPVRGTHYMVSNTVGKIFPAADWGTAGWYATELGVANATNQLVMSINATGVTHA